MNDDIAMHIVYVGALTRLVKVFGMRNNIKLIL